MKKLRDMPKWVFDVVLVGILMAIGSDIEKDIKKEMGIKVKEPLHLRILSTLIEICFLVLIVMLIVSITRWWIGC